MHGRQDTARVAVKAELGPVIADSSDGLAGDVRIVDDRLGRNLSGHDHHAGRQQGLAGHARHGVLR